MNYHDIRDQLITLRGQVDALIGNANEEIHAQEQEQEKERIRHLEQMIEEHDCHKSPEDSCPCDDWRRELAALTF